jgi:hypothetical protein
MRGLRGWAILAVWIPAHPTFASDHNIEAYAGPSYAGVFGSFRQAGGVQGSIAYGPLKSYSWNLVGDIGRHAVSLGGDDVEQTSSMFGLRWMLKGRKDPSLPPARKWLPFVQVVGGVIERRQNDKDRTAGAVAFGAGLDRIRRSGRKDEPGWRVLQVDYVVVGSGLPDALRVSTGFVYRWSE